MVLYQYDCMIIESNDMPVTPTALNIEQDNISAAVQEAQWIDPEYTWFGVIAHSGSGRIKLYVFISETGHTYSVKIESTYTGREYVFGISSIAECVNMDTDSVPSEVLSHFMPPHAIGMLQ